MRACMRLSAHVLALAVVFTAAPKPAEAHDGCHSRKCKARVAHRACDQKHPRACVLHVIYHQRITGWRRAWLLRIPECESGWNPYAINGEPKRRVPAPLAVIKGPPQRSAGLFQFMWSTWLSTPYGDRSIWSAFWQPYAAAYMLRVGRSGEWVCK